MRRSTTTAVDPDADVEAGLAAALRRVGDRWSLLVVNALLAGSRRYGELADDIDGIASNVLAARLRHLEAEGLVLATPYSLRPRRYAYELTATGRDLADALRLLAAWGGGGAGPAHAACGTPLEVRWWCPTCELTADDPGEPTFV